MLIKIIFIIPRGLINMNKNDIILFVVLVSIVSIFVVIISFFNNPQEKIAVVYSNQKEVLRIPLNLQNDGKEFVVEGYNGDVVLEVKNKKIRVKEEISPYNICSKQGFTDSVTKPIICLPNKVIIEIIGKNSSDLDAVIK